MSHPFVHRRRNRRKRPGLGALPDDLYVELQPWPHAGRPVKHDLEGWLVTDDWPERAPVTEAEVDVVEAWLGNILDKLFG